MRRSPLREMSRIGPNERSWRVMALYMGSEGSSGPSNGSFLHMWRTICICYVGYDH
jgi:hypothetical protein